MVDITGLKKVAGSVGGQPCQRAGGGKNSSGDRGYRDSKDWRLSQVG